MSNEDSKTLMDEILMSGKKKIHSISNSEIEKADEFCEPYKDFLNKSRTEREAVVEAVAQAKENGFEEYDPDRTYSAGDKIYIVNRNKAFRSNLHQTFMVWMITLYMQLSVQKVTLNLTVSPVQVLKV